MLYLSSHGGAQSPANKGFPTISLFDPLYGSMQSTTWQAWYLTTCSLQPKSKCTRYGVWNMEHVHMGDCVAIPVRIMVLGWAAGSGWSRELSLIAYPGLCPKLP